MNLIQKLEGLVNRAQSVQPASDPTAVAATSAPIKPEKLIEIAEPMFIPSRIVPQNAEVRIRVDESSTDDKTFESGADALRSALRKKP